MNTVQDLLLYWLIEQRATFKFHFPGLILELLNITSISDTAIRELLSLLDNNWFNKAETKQATVFYLDNATRKQYHVLH